MFRCPYKNRNANDSQYDNSRVFRCQHSGLQVLLIRLAHRPVWVCAPLLASRRLKKAEEANDTSHVGTSFISKTLHNGLRLPFGTYLIENTWICSLVAHSSSNGVVDFSYMRAIVIVIKRFLFF
jgi:hypothetical protein